MTANPSPAPPDEAGVLALIRDVELTYAAKVQSALIPGGISDDIRTCHTNARAALETAVRALLARAERAEAERDELRAFADAAALWERNQYTGSSALLRCLVEQRRRERTAALARPVDRKEGAGDAER